MRRPALQPVAENHVKVITIEQQQQIVQELHRAKTPQEQMAVTEWAMTYVDCYYYTPTGSLRRVFPNAKMLVRLRKKGKHASGQSQANIHRAQ